jgi:hypothetical protein
MIASILQLAARILGYGSYRNLPDTLYDRPDRTEGLPDGRIRRKWFRRTVWAVADARTGRQSTGRTPGTTGPRKPHRYADDPASRPPPSCWPRHGRLAGTGAASG